MAIMQDAPDICRMPPGQNLMQHTPVLPRFLALPPFLTRQGGGFFLRNFFFHREFSSFVNTDFKLPTKFSTLFKPVFYHSNGAHP
jgi:hypothetical protein